MTDIIKLFKSEVIFIVVLLSYNMYWEEDNESIVDDPQPAKKQKQPTLQNFLVSQSTSELSIQSECQTSNVETRVKKSKVWEFFKKDPNNKKLSVCLVCNTEIYSNGNTSNYWDHLHRYHAFKLKKSVEREEEESPSQYTPRGSELEGMRKEIENQ